MTNRRLTAFIDALAAGQRPRSFRADAEAAEMLRAALALRTARPGDARPDEKFVAELHDQLAATLDTSEGTNIHPFKRTHRARVALVSVAAGLALIGGTVAVTEISHTPSAQQSAMPVPNGKALRTGTFETSTGQVLGQIVVYQGHTSWVYMNVDVPNASGSVQCELHLANGDVVAAGTVQLHDGNGELSKSIQMDTGPVHGATLFDPSGAVVATATFA